LSAESAEHAATRDAIERDAQFVGRYISAALNGGSAAPIVSLVLNNYFALFIAESQQWLRLFRLGMPNPLSEDVRQIIKQSRNSLKLFEDSNRRIRGQLTYFKDGILSEHRSYFYDRFGDAVPPEATDLGIFRYSGSIICTTHSASFGLGVPAKKLLEEEGLVRGLAKDYGRYLSLWGTRITEAPSFLGCLDDALVGKDEDVRSCEFYARTFNEAGPEELNGFLSVLQSAMNFTSEILSLESNVESFYTVFKIRFLTLYHVIRSIRPLIGNRALTISSLSQSYILRIISNPMAKLIISDADVTGLRQSLVHYRPEARFVARLDTAAPLYGLLRAAFPGRTAMEAVGEVYQCAADTAALINDWAKRRASS